MKKRLLFLMLAFASLQTINAQDRILVAGASSDKIAIINRETQSIEWRYTGVEGECKKSNSVVYTKEGNVLFAYPKGAKMVNPKGETLFEYGVKEGEELNSVSDIEGGYLIGISGNPARFVEIDYKGKTKMEFTFDTGVENVHHQFRQIAKSPKGTYVVPIFRSKRVVEIDAKGEIIKDVKLKESSLYVSMDSKGDWLVTTGHAGTIYKVDGESGKVSTIVEGKDLGDGITIAFGAEIVELKNGNYLLANWLGHKGDQTQPMLIELDKKGKVVWKMNKIEGCTFVSGIYPIY